jgi:hypothetical protein
MQVESYGGIQFNLLDLAIHVAGRNVEGLPLPLILVDPDGVAV